MNARLHGDDRRECVVSGGQAGYAPRIRGGPGVRDQGPGEP
ncbi:hypothetical protein BIWAKO_02900 [Bosea sp. BIWAKO-01]|nr:hypothetical protein BIWAKO_02900 [Bosea sp. BIWAKO-01]